MARRRPEALRSGRKAPKPAQGPGADLPEIEHLTYEFGFTTRPSVAPRIQAAARIYGTKLATYLREIIEADANARCAEWERQHGRPAA